MNAPCTTFTRRRPAMANHAESTPTDKKELKMAELLSTLDNRCLLAIFLAVIFAVGVAAWAVTRSLQTLGDRVDRIVREHPDGGRDTVYFAAQATEREREGGQSAD